MARQCTDLDIPVLDSVPQDGRFDLVIDAIFGYSFTGEAREPFKSIIAWMARTSTPVMSIDVPSGKHSFMALAGAHSIDSLSTRRVMPSGWHVSDGDVYKTGLVPSAVVSMMLPKECMRNFSGRHFVGGRFVPPAVATRCDGL